MPSIYFDCLELKFQEINLNICMLNDKNVCNIAVAGTIYASFTSMACFVYLSIKYTFGNFQLV